MIYRLFGKNPDSRDDIITVTSGLNIAMNMLISVAKIIIGSISSSIAIVSEGLNNMTDALTSVLTLLGAKLAKKHPDEKHPFGYGRIEYLVGLIIAVAILFSGFEVLKSSVSLIFEPKEMDISYLALAIVAGSAVIKFLVGTYTVKMGTKADSGALVGVGLDSRSDSYSSIITIVTSLVFILSGISLDAYAGIIIAALILKAGYDVLKDTVSDLLGRPGEKELATKIYELVRKTDGVLAAADMMLHNYGPDAWSGSVNVEMDHSMTAGEIYRTLHRLQLDIMHEYSVTMVFGVYAVDNDHDDAKALRKHIADFVKAHEHVKSFHAVFLCEEEKEIYTDFIVDYKLRDWDALHDEFCSAMNELYPGYRVELTIETEFV